MTLNVYVVSLAALVFLFCFETHMAMGVGGLNLTEEAWSILKQSTRGEGKTNQHTRKHVVVVVPRREEKHW